MLVECEPLTHVVQIGSSGCILCLQRCQLLIHEGSELVIGHRIQNSIQAVGIQRCIDVITKQGIDLLAFVVECSNLLIGSGLSDGHSVEGFCDISNDILILLHVSLHLSGSLFQLSLVEVAFCSTYIVDHDVGRQCVRIILCRSYPALALSVEDRSQRRHRVVREQHMEFHVRNQRTVVVGEVNQEREVRIAGPVPIRLRSLTGIGVVKYRDILTEIERRCWVSHVNHRHLGRLDGTLVVEQLLYV